MAYLLSVREEHVNSSAGEETTIETLIEYQVQNKEEGLADLNEIVHLILHGRLGLEYWRLEKEFNKSRKELFDMIKADPNDFMKNIARKFPHRISFYLRPLVISMTREEKIAKLYEDVNPFKRDPNAILACGTCHRSGAF
jgi:hypothetical protein